MSDIDVTYCAFARLNDVCASPINIQECKCSKIPIQNCYHKQLQQLKSERDLLLNQLVVLDGEDVTVQVTQEQFEEYNKLKSENEELKEELEIHKIATEVFVAGHRCYKKQAEENYELWQKADKCLDEIEDYIDNFCENVCPYYIDEGESCDNCMLGDIVQPIKQKIKEVKNE